MEENNNLYDSMVDINGEKFKLQLDDVSIERLENIPMLEVKRLLNENYFEIIDDVYTPLEDTKQITRREAELIRFGYYDISRITKIIQNNIVEIRDADNIMRKITIKALYNILHEINSAKVEAEQSSTERNDVA